MRSIVDEELVRKRATRARRGILVGMVVLIAAAVLSFNPQYLLPAYGMIIPGVIVAGWGTRTAEKWLQEPRIDQMLSKALKGLPQGYRLYSYVLPAEQVILAPSGLFVLNAKRQDGPITCQGDRWRRPFGIRRLLNSVTESRLGNPTKQVRGEAEQLQRLLSTQLPDVDVPIQPVVVFTHPDVELTVDEPAVPTMLLSHLKAHLRGAGKVQGLSKQAHRAVLELFEAQTR